MILEARDTEFNRTSDEQNRSNRAPDYWPLFNDFARRKTCKSFISKNSPQTHARIDLRKIGLEIIVSNHTILSDL